MENDINQFPSQTFEMVQIVPNKGQIVVKNGNAVTFWGRCVGSKSGYIYTFNAFGEARERVLRLNLKNGSRVIITGFQKEHKVGNHYQFSTSVSAIDYCPANDDGFRKKAVEKLLAGGKLSVEEIADTVSLPVETVMKIRNEMQQSRTQEPQKASAQVQEKPVVQQAQQHREQQAVPQQTQQIEEQEPDSNVEMDIERFLQLYST